MNLVDKLRATTDVLDVAAADRIEQLERELVAARADAERWHAVRDDPRLQGSRNGYSTFTKTVDAAIDAAIAREKP